jgi:ArsR family transcriptional regulator
MERTEKQIALIFKALSDENRIRILKLLHNGEMCACKLLDALNISQPTLSHHMKILCDAGIVNGRKEGKWMHYSICSESGSELSAMLHQLLSAANVPDNCCCKEK